RRGLRPLAPAGRRGAAAGDVPGQGIPSPAAGRAGLAPRTRAAGAGGGVPGAPGKPSGVPALPPGVARAPGPGVLRRGLDGGPVAPLKIASGCDRRCSFCAIPAFRGAFLSRPPADLVAEAEWLTSRGVRELLLVSENSTSYGKDLGNLRLLDELLPALAAVPGVARIRVSYLQPAELRPGLVEVMTSTPGVAPYFDLSFQHASGRVLRAMRRFGDGPRFCALLDQIRQASPQAGVRSNFIVGFPGETPQDVAELEEFLSQARLDAIGTCAASAEDGTGVAPLGGQLDPAEIARRADDLSDLAEELMAQRAADRRGETVEVLIEEQLGPGHYQGRAAHQAPEVDGVTTVRSQLPLAVGDMISAVVAEFEGVDLVAEAHLSARAAAPAQAGIRGPRGAPATGSGGAPVTAQAEPPFLDGAGAVVPPQPGLVNLANGLTVIRLILVPVVVACLLAGGAGWRVAAFVAFATASVTDLLDGRIARSRGLITDFGKIADPIADKALTGAALVTMSSLGWLPWWVTVVILAREVVVTGLRFWVIRHGVIAASRGGKLKTLLQVLAISLYMLPGVPEWLREAVMA